MKRIVGLDLGQAGDPAAVAVLDRIEGCVVRQGSDGRWGVWDWDAGAWHRFGADATFKTVVEARERFEASELPRAMGPRTLLCSTLRLWPLETDYNAICTDVCAQRWDVLVPDFSGVGRPVVDILNKERARVGHKGHVSPVATVASSARGHAGYETRGIVYHTVPKIELVSSLVVVQQDKRLALPAVPETKLLLDQLDDYRMRYSKRGVEQFGNVGGVGKHDDLVSALALACWHAIHFGARRPVMEV